MGWFSAVKWILGVKGSKAWWHIDRELTWRAEFAQDELIADG